MNIYEKILHQFLDVFCILVQFNRYGMVLHFVQAFYYSVKVYIIICSIKLFKHSFGINRLINVE